MKLIYTTLLMITVLLIQCKEAGTDAETNENTEIIKDSSEFFIEPLDSSESTILQDTTFLLRTLEDGVYHAIYIETNRNSIFHQALADFSFDKNDSTCYDDTYDFFMDMNHNAELYNQPNSLTKCFVPLYQYEDEFYVYAPSDWGNTKKRMITDSTFMFWYMDGVSPYLISAYSKKNEKEHSLTYLVPYGGKKLMDHQVKIFLLDDDREIYLFEYESPYANEENSFQLYTTKDNVEDFDAIVNYSPFRKQLEYHFDPPSFELIKSGN